MHAEYVELAHGRYFHYLDTDACGVVEVDRGMQPDLGCRRQAQGPYEVRADTIILVNEGDQLSGDVSSEHRRMVLGRVGQETVLWRTPHWKERYEQDGKLEGYDPLLYVGKEFDGRYPDCRALGWYAQWD